MKKIAGHQKSTRVKIKKGLSKQTIFLRRVIIITTCVVLSLITLLVMNKSTLQQSVAGAKIMRGHFNQSTIMLTRIPSAVSYTIYYKRSNEILFSNAARDIPTNVLSYTISYLKKGAQYEYKIAALDSSGKEFYFSPILAVENLVPMD